MAMFTKRRPLGETVTAKSGGTGRTLGIILGIVIIAILVMSCFTRVPTGNTGIVTTFGKVENYTLDAGMHLKLPWQKIVKMDNRVQKQRLRPYVLLLRHSGGLHDLHHQLSDK